MMSTARPFRLPRRTFLRGALGTAVALPWLEAMSVRNARAAAPPVRFICVAFENGSLPECWQPVQEGRGYAMRDGFRPLEPFRDSVSILSGLHQRIVNANGGFEHHIGVVASLTAGPCTRPTGGNKGKDGKALYPSLDQVIGERLKSQTAIPALVLSERGGNRFRSWRGPMEKGPALRMPADIFKALFPRGGVPGTAPDGKRRAILDYVREDATRLMTRLGGEDRIRVGKHLAAVDEVDRKYGLLANRTASCAQPSAPAATPDARHAWIPLVKLALSCDLTRSVLIDVGYYDGVTPNAANSFESDHGVSHGAAPGITRTTAVKMSYVARLLSALQDSKEGDSNILHNSIVIANNDIGKGPKHDFDNIPMFIAGNAGGRIATGSHLRYDDVPIGRLYVTVLKAMGFPDNKFGADGDGVLPGILA